MLARFAMSRADRLLALARRRLLAIGAFLLLAARTAAAQPRPLVRRRPLGRRAPAALARQPAHGARPAADRAWTRNLSPPPSRTTNPPRWRARIPISPTNRRTIFSSMPWWGRASRAAAAGRLVRARVRRRLEDSRHASRCWPPCLAAALAAGIVSQQFTAFTIPTAVIFFATIALAAGLADGPRRPSTVRRLPLGLPLLYFAARIAFADHALALTQRDLEAAISPAPPRTTRPPGRPATSGTRAPCSPSRGRRPHRRPPASLSTGRRSPGNAPRAPPKIPSTPGTASPRSAPRTTTPPVRSTACAPPSRPIPIGSNRTGRWHKSCVSNRGRTKRSAKPRWLPTWMAANIPKLRARLQD